MPDAPSEASVLAAARWAIRTAEGLTAGEQGELARWLAADPAHESLLREHQGAWARFDPLAVAAAAAPATENGAALGEVTPFPAPSAAAASHAAPAWRRSLYACAGVALAAALAVGVFLTATRRAEQPAIARVAALSLPALCEQQTLLDGSTVELNRGAAIATEFLPSERRVRLLRGEATFTVAKDPARPFVVVAGGVDVRALGTVFNVRLGQEAADVLVTEGSVRVAAPVPAVAADAEADANAAVDVADSASHVLTAGQQVVMPAEPGATAGQVTSLSLAEIERRLSWQPRLLRFDDAPLVDIVDAFNRRNPVRLVVVDPQLCALRLTLTFRSDNVAGFVRLIGDNYGIRAEPRSEHEVVLQRK